MPDVMVHIQPPVADNAKLFSLCADHRNDHWILPIYRYTGPDALLTALPKQVIAPAEAMAREVRRLPQVEEE